MGERTFRRKSATVLNHPHPREQPAYTITEAAHYLQIPLATLRSWVRGRYYTVQRGQKFFDPVIELPEVKPALLSFVNLVEAHILNAIRRKYYVKLPKVRTAIVFLQKQFHTKHPLADQIMETDGKNLFVEKFGTLINVSQEGQLAMRELIQAHLKRIERDTNGIAIRLYPFTRMHEIIQPKVVVIDPYVSFGRPVVAGTGIPTLAIAERYKAGESIEELADDYRLEGSKIQEAIRCELNLEAA